MAPIFFGNADEEQLRYVPPVMKQVIETFDVRLAISGQTNTRELTGVDPAKQARTRPGHAAADRRPSWIAAPAATCAGR